MKKLLMTMFVTILGLGFCLSFLPAVECGAEPVKIGYVGPVTWDYGKTQIAGAKLAVEEVNKAGGIDWLLARIRSMIKGRKSAEIGIAALVSLTDAATANNTVAIIIDGPIAKEISTEYQVDPRRSASLLDSFSCIMQGLIPYGAQMLIAVGFTNGAVSAFEVIPLLWYQLLLGVLAIVSIFVPFNVLDPNVGLALVWYCNPGDFDTEPQLYTLPIDTNYMEIQSFPIEPEGLSDLRTLEELSGPLT